MANINELDSPYLIADALFNDFELLQSCTITGFQKDKDGRLERRGEVILKILDNLDKSSNMQTGGDKRPRRKRVKPPNTIGGYVAQKIWKYKHEIIDSEPRTTIWRIQ